MEDLKIMTATELCGQLKKDKEISLAKQVNEEIKKVRNAKGVYDSSFYAKMFKSEYTLSSELVQELTKLGYVYSEHVVEVYCGSSKKVYKSFLGIKYDYYYQYVPKIETFKYYKVTACCGDET